MFLPNEFLGILIIKYCWLLSNAFFVSIVTIFYVYHSDDRLLNTYWFPSRSRYVYMLLDLICWKYLQLCSSRTCSYNCWETFIFLIHSIPLLIFITESLHYLLLIFIADLLYSVIDLARFSVFSWLNFSRLCVSINLFLSLSPWCRFSSSLNLIIG